MIRIFTYLLIILIIGNTQAKEFQLFTLIKQKILTNNQTYTFGTPITTFKKLKDSVTVGDTILGIADAKIIVNKRYIHSNDDITLIANIDNNDNYNAVITISSSAMFAKITTQDGIYNIKTTAIGEILLTPADNSLIKPLVVNDNDNIIVELSAQDKFLYPTSTLTETNNITYTNIDIMVFWDLPFQAYSGNATNALTRLNQVIAEANTNFTNSKIYINLNLVYSGLKNFPPDVATNATVLRYLRDNNSNYDFGDIDELKATHKPDLVGLIRQATEASNADNICGIAYVLGSNGITSIANSQNAFFIVNRGQAISTSCYDTTFSHEIGHNLGSVHDLANSSNTPLFDYSYAYGETQTASVYGTIMSYASSRLNIFSNPDISCATSNSNAPDIACGDNVFNNNAKGFNAIRNSIANFDGNTANSIANIAAENTINSGGGCSMLVNQSGKIDLILLLFMLLSATYLRKN